MSAAAECLQTAQGGVSCCMDFMEYLRFEIKKLIIDKEIYLIQTA